MSGLLDLKISNYDVNDKGEVLLSDYTLYLNKSVLTADYIKLLDEGCISKYDSYVYRIHYDYKTEPLLVRDWFIHVFRHLDKFKEFADGIRVHVYDTTRLTHKDCTVNTKSVANLRFSNSLVTFIQEDGIFGLTDYFCTFHKSRTPDTIRFPCRVNNDRTSFILDRNNMPEHAPKIANRFKVVKYGKVQIKYGVRKAGVGSFIVDSYAITVCLRCGLSELKDFLAAENYGGVITKVTLIGVSDLSKNGQELLKVTLIVSIKENYILTKFDLVKQIKDLCGVEFRVCCANTVYSGVTVNINDTVNKKLGVLHNTLCNKEQYSYMQIPVNGLPKDGADTYIYSK